MGVENDQTFVRVSQLQLVKRSAQKYLSRNSDRIIIIICIDFIDMQEIPFTVLN